MAHSCNHGSVRNVSQFDAPHLLPPGQPRKFYRSSLNRTHHHILAWNATVASPLKERVRSLFPVLVEKYCKNSVQCTHGVVTIVITARKLLGITYTDSADILQSVASQLFMAFPGSFYMSLLDQLGRYPRRTLQLDRCVSTHNGFLLGCVG